MISPSSACMIIGIGAFRIATRKRFSARLNASCRMLSRMEQSMITLKNTAWPSPRAAGEVTSSIGIVAPSWRVSCKFVEMMRLSLLQRRRWSVKAWTEDLLTKLRKASPSTRPRVLCTRVVNAMLAARIEPLRSSTTQATGARSNISRESCSALVAGCATATPDEGRDAWLSIVVPGGILFTKPVQDYARTEQNFKRIKRICRYLDTVFDVPNAARSVPDTVLDVRNAARDVPDAVFDVPNATRDVPDTVLDVRNAARDVPDTVLDVRNAARDVPGAVLDVRNATRDVPDTVLDVGNAAPDALPQPFYPLTPRFFTPSMSTSVITAPSILLSPVRYG